MNIYSKAAYMQDIKNTIDMTVAIEKLKNKKILVTGSTGTIGSYIVDTLLTYSKMCDGNICVYAACRNKDRYLERFRECPYEMHYLEYDMLKDIEFDMDFDYIIHVAGNAYPTAFTNNPVETIVGNVNSTYNILEYARQHSVRRVLYISSGEVYGNIAADIKGVKEDQLGDVDVLMPRACYPLSKRATENLCVSYNKEYGTDVVIVRPCYTYGPTITRNDNRANAQFIRNAVEGNDIVLKSSGEQVRSYCYVADCAAGILTVLINGKTAEAYNCANPDSVLTIADFARTIAGIAGTKIVMVNPTNQDIANRSPIRNQILDSAKLCELGWKPTYKIEKGIGSVFSILK